MHRNKSRNKDMIERLLTDFLMERYRLVEQVENTNSFLESRLFKMILSGDAKLPLDRVEEVADLLDCDKRQLFRMAMRQFYDKESISTLERMLGNPLTEEEQQWLDIIRSASGADVGAPSTMAKRLVRALAKPQETE
jgi:transposase-like protein